MINSCSPTVLTINVVDAQTFAIFHTCKCTRIHRIYRIILYRYIRGIEITGWDGSIRMVAGESSGEPTFRGCVIRRRKRMGTDDSGCYWKSNISRRFYSIDLHRRNISNFFHFHPSSCNDITWNKFIEIVSSTVMRASSPGSSFRISFYRDLGSGRRHVSHAAHHAATINDRRVIKVGHCPYYNARDIKFCDHRSGAN